MKYEFQNPKYNFLPVINFSLSDRIAMHTTFISSSSAGKSYLASQFILKNVQFPRQKKIYIIYLYIYSEGLAVLLYLLHRPQNKRRSLPASEVAMGRRP